MLGDSVMIAPVLTQNATGRYVYLPEEMKLLRLRSATDFDEEILPKGHHYVPCQLDEALLFIRPDKLIPVSRILLGAAKASLMNYLNRWFVKNAVLSENQKIFTTLKAGYNEGTPKAVAGWKALKKSINKDLDPSCKIDGVIITNQSGWACLDEEEDADGRPVLKENPSHVTEKMFQSLPVYVFPDSHLPNIDDTHFPVIYGSTKAGATFVEHNSLEFAISEHFLFNKNQNCLRVIEGFDVMSTDTDAYIYGSFSATPNA